MAKKTEKGKKKKGSSGPADTLREAVERTFAGASGGAVATRDRAQELLEDIAGQLRGLRDANLVGTLEGLREEVQSLARRVASLELRADEAKKPASTTARKPAATRPAARKPATSRAKSTAAKPAGRKPAAAKSTAAKRTTARKPGGSSTRKPSS